MDGSNVGWWVPVLTLAVPLFLLLSLHLLARLEEWMFSPDDRAAKVAQLLERAGTPDEIEREVTRMLAQVTDRRPSGGGGARRINDLSARRPRRVPAANQPAEGPDHRSG